MRRDVDLDGAAALNMYFRFRPSSWGHGFAFEMASAAVEWANESRPGEPVVIATEPSNQPAQGLAVRLGFVHTGEQTTDEGPLMIFRAADAR